MTQNELLTPAEVAKLLRVTPATVLRWARVGEIESVRIANTTRIPRLSLLSRIPAVLAALSPATA